jgi:hypothetical protein
MWSHADTEWNHQCLHLSLVGNLDAANEILQQHVALQVQNTFLLIPRKACNQSRIRSTSQWCIPRSGAGIQMTILKLMCTVWLDEYEECSRALIRKCDGESYHPDLLGQLLACIHKIKAIQDRCCFAPSSLVPETHDNPKRLPSKDRKLPRIAQSFILENIHNI